MSRGIWWFLVGSLGLAVLAGCKPSWLAERESWRREAEVACLKSGAVKESPAVAMLGPINGPGMCGADFPIKVVALGESHALGYADEVLRPPGAVPQGGYARPLPPPRGPQYPADTPFQVNPAYPHDTRLPPTDYRPEPPLSRAVPSRDFGAPMSIIPPGIDPPEEEEAERLPARRYPAPPRIERPSSYEPRESVPRYPGASVPMSPSRGKPAVTGSVAATMTPAATLACPMVSALDRWIAEAVQPAARKWFNQPVAEIKQISAYSCRGMNGQAGARISEHAFGNALDIAAFVLADGHRITVKGGWRGTPEEQGFLRDVQLAACDQFATVLAPGSNVYHYDHIHVDLMRRASGRRICQPAAVAGEIVAARARGRYATKADGSITGSVAPRRLPTMMRRLPDSVGEEESDRHLPLAIAGED